MDTDQLRISPAKLLLLVAICIVLLVELRTVLGLFGLDVSVEVVLAFGVFVIVAVVLWAVIPAFRTSDDR